MNRRPISCTIGSDEISERIDLVERMRANLSQVERTDHGLRLRFPSRADVEVDLRRFAIDEERCCRFWRFAVDTTDGVLTLRWDGPPAAGDLLDQLHAYFEGDAPLTLISGLRSTSTVDRPSRVRHRPTARGGSTRS